MSFTLPQQAEDYFNGQARETLLLLEYQKHSERELRQEGESSLSHAFIAAHIGEKDIIGSISVEERDYLGTEVSKYFETAQGFFGFSGENYLRVEKIIHGISQKKELRDLISKEFIKKTFFVWVEGKYKNEIPVSCEFLEYLKEKSSQEIKCRKISIPIDFMNIQSSFKLGHIEFEYFRAELFDNIESSIREHEGEITQNIEIGVRQIRKKYQGKTYASIKLCGETHKCIEIAKREVDKSLTILLLFSLPALHPKVPAYVGRMGNVKVPVCNVLIFEGDLPRISEFIEEKRERYISVDNEYVQKMKELKIEKFNELLVKENLSNIEDLLINCISIYVKGVRSNDFQDKLVFTLVSIETLLLRDNQEPIQASVGLRLAFLYGSTIESRKNVIKLVKDAYIYRSKYIHHGNKKEEDFELLQNLQSAVWTAIYNVVMMKDNLSSQEELIDSIQERVLS